MCTVIIENINSNLPNFSANFQYGNSSIIPKHLKMVADNFEKETSFYPHCTNTYF